ncbi:hypothetical protein BJV82DRAFT_599245 [Fennellomyces sp. T-0311]|nr:hypothetical protein BJV82DRAFT_599245 [Fennellomyces sp. T-0311]
MMLYSRQPKKSRETKKTKRDITNGTTLKEDEKMDVDTIDKEDVWIGATDANKVGLYYGAAGDERNWTGRPELEPEHSLEDACVWAAIQAIDRCANDAKKVVIYTDCHGLCNDENRNPLREQLDEKINNRTGSTVILHTLPAASAQLQKAQELVAVVTKTQLNGGTANEQEDEPTKEKSEVSAPQDHVLEKDTVALQVSEPAREDEDMQAGENGIETAAEEQAAPTPASWRPAGGLRNLLDILMAPFSRRARTQ